MTSKPFALLFAGTCFLLTTGLPGFAGDDEPEKAKSETGKKENKNDKEEVRQSNPFTRFWIHTVGAPMARGMRDGTRKVYKGLKIGARKIKNTFTGGSKKQDHPQKAREDNPRSKQ